MRNGPAGRLINTRGNGKAAPDQRRNASLVMKELKEVRHREAVKDVSTRSAKMTS